MTVVAYRNDIIAADSQATLNEFIGLENRKLAIKNNTVIGVAGDFDVANTARDWVFAGSSKTRRPQLSETEIKRVNLLIVRKTKKGIRVSEMIWSLNELPVVEEYTAIGSGFDIVIACMDAGASAIEAVEIACKRHIYCNLPIFYVDMDKEKLEIKQWA